MAEQGRRVIAAACDGACSGNPGPGGWGALLRFEDGAVQELGGADRATTNNRMELTAALALFEILRDLPRHPELVIRTDSRYLIDGLQKWLPGWKRKGWRTASGGQVLNRDLWERLDRARLADVRLVHVRGHSGDADNDRCDAIAVAFSRGQRPDLAEAGPSALVGAQAAGFGSVAGSDSAAATDAVAATPGRARSAARHSSGSAAGTPTTKQASRGTGGPESEAAASATAAAADSADDLAPAGLQQLLSRLEIAERLARGGFALSLLELAQLVEQPVRSLEQRQEAWIWRDWLVQPVGQGRWRLVRDAGGLERRE